MFEISVRSRFSAAHHLKGYPGTCSAVHGHNWDVEVFLQGEELNDEGLLVDFRQLKEMLGEVIEQLDHADLNKLEAFAEENPSSENLARFLYKELSRRINCDRYGVSRVRVGETPETAASYVE